MAQRRIWSTEDGTVCLRQNHGGGDFGDEETVREFWVPSSGGYVREIDARHPGTLGQQVCAGLAHRGNTLHSSREGLLDLVRSEYRRAEAGRRREMAA